MSDLYYEQLVPSLGVNESQGVITEWSCSIGQFIKTGDLIAIIETTKVAIEVESQFDGYIDHLVQEDVTVNEGQCIALLSKNKKDLEVNRGIYIDARKIENISEDFMATQKARDLADKLSVELSLVAKNVNGVIRTKDVSDYHSKNNIEKFAYSKKEPIKRNFNGRVLIIGGGKGATQLLSVFSNEEGTEVVGILDDTRDKQDTMVKGVPILGYFSDLKKIVTQNKIDSVICSVSTSVQFRKSVFTECIRLNLVMANAIHSSVVFDDDVTIGVGNFIGANCYFGNSVSIGNYSFISSGCIFEHHNTIGDGLSTGPNVVTSGTVTFGKHVSIGTGVHFEPNLKIGERTIVSSGACIVEHVPDEKVVIKSYSQHLK